MPLDLAKYAMIGFIIVTFLFMLWFVRILTSKAMNRSCECERSALRALQREIATVRLVAERRSDPDTEHRQMINRLSDWEDQLEAVITKGWR